MFQAGPSFHCYSTNFLHVSSLVGRKARALYACKAEHDSELSFIAGTIFENVVSQPLDLPAGEGKNVGRCVWRNK